MPRKATKTKPTPTRKFSPQGRKNIREGVRARWVRQRQEEIRILSERLRLLKAKQREALGK